MRRVASTVNERKRRIENIKKLAKWQVSILLLCKVIVTWLNRSFAKLLSQGYVVF